MLRFNRPHRAMQVSLAALALACGWGLGSCPDPSAHVAVRAAMVARAEAGRPPTAAMAADLTLWWVCAGGLVLTLLLAATSRWWAVRHEPVLAAPADRLPAVGLLRLRWVLAVIVLLAMVPRLPRMTHSFWNDEETTIQDYAWGEWKEGNDGRYTFRAVPWIDTLFYNRGGSNHIANSVATRLSLAAAASLGIGYPGAENGRFHEASARILPLLASLAGIWIFGHLVARATGSVAAGAAAALVLACHPWHARYSTEVRGYALMLAAMLLSIDALWRALATGRRRWWACFAAAQALYLLCFAGAVYMAMAVNLVALMAVGGTSSPQRWSALAALIAWNAVAALPVAVFMAPSLPQFAYYLVESKRMIAFGSGLGWERDFLSHFLTGLRPVGDAAGLSRGIGMVALGWHGRALLWLGPLAACSGLLWQLCRRGAGFARGLAAIFLLAPLLSYAHNRIADNPTMPWYLLYSLFALGLGWASLLQAGFRLRGSPCAALPPTVAIAVVLALWLPVALCANAVQSSVPRQPLREVAAALAGRAPTYGKCGDDGGLLLTFGTSAKRLHTYCPEVRVIDSPGELDAAVAEADRRHLPVRIAYCGRQLALTKPDRPADGELVRALEAGAHGFVPTGTIQGMEELFSYHTYIRAPR